MYPIIVTNFTTTNAEEDILATQTTIRQRLCERLGLTDTALTEQLANKKISMDVTIFFSGTNGVSINNGLYQSAIEDSVYASGKIYPATIKIQNIASGKIMIDIQ